MSVSEFVSTKELAAQLGVTDATLKQWRHRGVGPAFIRLGTRAIRYARVDVEAWIAAHRIGGAS